MYKYILRTILSVLCLTALFISTMSCINVNMPKAPADSENTPGDQAAPPVAVDLPTIDSFSASPASVLEGKSSTLSWSVKNANAITITPGIGTVSATGSKTVTPSAATTYTLVASNAAGMQSRAVVINILMVRKQTDLVPVAELPTIDSFSASPASVLEGKSSTLSWSIKNANAITITPGIGTVSATGSKTVTPSAATTYTLVASNAAGMQSKAVVINILMVRKLQPNLVETKKPDLIISEIKIGSVVGQTHAWSTIRNLGTDDSTPCSVILIIDGQIVNTESVKKIEPGGFIDHAFAYLLNGTQEPHTFEVKIDSDNTVVESYETNNSKIVQLNYK